MENRIVELKPQNRIIELTQDWLALFLLTKCELGALIFLVLSFYLTG